MGDGVEILAVAESPKNLWLWIASAPHSAGPPARISCSAVTASGEPLTFRQMQGAGSSEDQFYWVRFNAPPDDVVQLDVTVEVDDVVRLRKRINPL